MRTFEVLRRTAHRWELAGVFSDAAPAVAAAKSLLENARVPEAVRVMAVEPRSEGFAEWSVYRQSTSALDRDSVPGGAGAERAVSGLGKLPHIGAPADPSRLPPSWKEEPMSRSTLAALLVAALVLCGIVYLLSPSRPDSHASYIFDSPVAHQKQAIRNPWSGEVSR